MDENTVNSVKTIRPGGESSLGRIDQYELIRELGGGGFGSVYLARDTVSGVDVAVKGLPPDVKGNPEELENIRENFRLVSRLHHPNIAAALVLHPAADVYYADDGVRRKLRVLSGDTLLVMAYAPGVTLSQWRRQFPERRAPLDRALLIVRQVAAALDYAHGERIIHRDVKPSNVMVETAPDGSLTARVLDFGLAAEIRSSMGRVSREVCDTSGTRPYMAPEQWLGRGQRAATDQYALAVLFHELVTGAVPFASAFETGDPTVMRMTVIETRPEIPAALPKPVRLALAKALAKDPAERFASCGAFVEALEGKVEPSSGNRFAKAFLAAACLAVLAAGGAFLMRDIHGTSATDGTDVTVPLPSQVSRMPQPEGDAEEKKAETGPEVSKVETSKPEILQTETPKEEAPKTEVVPPAEEAREKQAEQMARLLSVEAKVCRERVMKLSDGEGFDVKKVGLNEAFTRATAEYEANLWTHAVTSFTVYTNQCGSLIELDGERKAALAMRGEALKARNAAKDAEAEQHAEADWAGATNQFEMSEEMIRKLSFLAASNAFAKAISQFGTCVTVAERRKQELEAIAEKKNKATELRSEADSFHDKIKRFSDEDGFGEKKVNLGKLFTEAEGFYEACQWDAAVSVFEDYKSQCEKLIKLDAERNEADEAKKIANQWQFMAEREDVPTKNSEGWREACAHLDAASEFYRNGSYTEACREYNLATKLLKRASGHLIEQGRTPIEISRPVVPTVPRPVEQPIRAYSPYEIRIRAYVMDGAVKRYVNATCECGSQVVKVGREMNGGVEQIVIGSQSQPIVKCVLRYGSKKASVFIQPSNEPGKMKEVELK